MADERGIDIVHDVGDRRDRFERARIGNVVVQRELRDRERDLRRHDIPRRRVGLERVEPSGDVHQGVGGELPRRRSAPDRDPARAHAGQKSQRGVVGNVATDRLERLIGALVVLRRHQHRREPQQQARPQRRHRMAIEHRRRGIDRRAHLGHAMSEQRLAFGTFDGSNRFVHRAQPYNELAMLRA